MKERTIGQIAYEGYHVKSSVDIAPWHEIKTEVQGAWEAAAAAVLTSQVSKPVAKKKPPASRSDEK